MRDFLHFLYFERQAGAAVCVPPNREKLTSWRRVGDDEATTTQQNKANTGPTPDPNYKREPFATHSGKKEISVDLPVPFLFKNHDSMAMTRDSFSGSNFH